MEVRTLFETQRYVWLIQRSNLAQAMRLLYRLRVSGEQRPFDTTSLFYILPFILLAMTSGGIGASSQDEVDEQIVLSLDFISFHTAICNPRLSLPASPVINRFKVQADCCPATRFFNA